MFCYPLPNFCYSYLSKNNLSVFSKPTSLLCIEGDLASLSTEYSWQCWGLYFKTLILTFLELQSVFSGSKSFDGSSLVSLSRLEVEVTLSFFCFHSRWSWKNCTEISYWESHLAQLIKALSKVSCSVEVSELVNFLISSASPTLFSILPPFFLVIQTFWGSNHHLPLLTFQESAHSFLQNSSLHFLILPHLDSYLQSFPLFLILYFSLFVLQQLPHLPLSFLHCLPLIRFCQGQPPNFECF